MKKVLIIDTSILCVWLGVPGKETCGSDDDRWDLTRVKSVLTKEEADGATFVLPLVAIIETGNHIAQARTKRYEVAFALANLMKLTADQTTPWAAFKQQSELWDAEHLKQLADEFPKFADQKLSIGDATIKRVADYYSRMGSPVEILTGDQGLKSYEPAKPPLVPRRRKNKN